MVLYYFLLMVAYAVLAVLTNKPLWVFFGLTFPDYEAAPAGDTSALLIPIIVFFAVSLFIGIISKMHYSFYDKEFRKERWTNGALRVRIVPRYLFVVIASIVTPAFQISTENGFLADIQAGYGVVKTIIFIVVLVLLGIPVCLGTLVFYDQKKKGKRSGSSTDYAAVSSDYRQERTETQAFRGDYRSMSDEELFPELMKRSASERVSGNLTRDYRDKAEKSSDDFLSKYRKGIEVTGQKARLAMRASCRETINLLWASMNDWLSKRLRDPGSVDSFPENLIDLGESNVTLTLTSTSLSDEGMEMMEEREEKEREFERRMREWNKQRDTYERASNTAFTAGDSSFDSALLTNEESYLQGKVSMEEYSNDRFRREADEAEERRKLREELGLDEYTSYDYDTETKVLHETIPLKLNYFSSMQHYIDQVKHDWNELGKRTDAGGNFYRMLYPVYAVGHKRKNGLNASDILDLVLPFVFVALFLLTRSMQAKYQGSFLGVIFGAANAFTGILAIITVLGGLFTLYLIIKDAIDLHKDKLPEKARAYAPILYLQMRYYRLWMKDIDTVSELEEILNDYYEAT